jgi:glycosyltransferase involved in cell wall biosynthesis
MMPSMNTIVTKLPKIAVVIPCYNEELTITDVVTAFRSELPTADIYVFDNNSTDRTSEFALRAGATVLQETRQGKGFVVQTMFRAVEADVYVMVDGDATYPASDVHRLLEPIVSDKADMVVGSRLHSATKSEFRSLNRWGNRLVLRVLNSIFGVRLTDILSGYRAFNRKFVKEVPLFGGGFEIETELTIKAIARGWRIVEIPTTLTSRPEGSHSKIKFFRDGAIILNTVLALFRDYKPLTFFGSVGLILFLIALVPETIIAVDSLRNGFVTNILWAVFSVGLSLTGLLLIAVGLILHTIVRRFQELEHTMQVRHDDFRSHLSTNNSNARARDES